MSNLSEKFQEKTVTFWPFAVPQPKIWWLQIYLWKVRPKFWQPCSILETWTNSRKIQQTSRLQNLFKVIWKVRCFSDILLNKIGRIIFTFLPQFFRPSQLKYHNERAHEEKRPHSCPQCDKSFYKKSDLRSHAKLHLGLKEYICRFCHQRFAHVSNLNRHKLTHKKEKPYSCQICGQRYNQIATLNQHCKKKHDILHKKSKTKAGSKNKVFYCKFCEKNFEHKADLDLHQVKHGQESYPYNCKRCKKGMNLVCIFKNVCDTQISREINLEPCKTSNFYVSILILWICV